MNHSFRLRLQKQLRLVHCEGNFHRLKCQMKFAHRLPLVHALCFCIFFLHSVSLPIIEDVTFFKSLSFHKIIVSRFSIKYFLAKSTHSHEFTLNLFTFLYLQLSDSVTPGFSCAYLIQNQNQIQPGIQMLYFTQC